MRYYVIINSGQYNKLVSDKIKTKKKYDSNTDFEIKDVVLSVIGQLTNNKYVLQACYSDAQYLNNKCATFQIDDEELQDWKDEFGEVNVITSLEGLDFKTTDE